MGRFEFDSIYGIFGKESVLDLFSTAFRSMKASCQSVLKKGIELYYSSSSSEVTFERVNSDLNLSEKAFTEAVRGLVRAGILRKTSYKPVVYRYLDPVRFDQDHLLQYSPFAQQIADEFGHFRIPGPYEILLVYGWKVYPGLPENVILEVVRHALEISPETGIKSAEILLPIVRGARDREDAAGLIAGYRQLYEEAREILSILGQNREPSQRELETYSFWKNEWGFSFKAIQNACEATVSGEPTFDYLGGILRNIHHEAETGRKMDPDAVSDSFRLTQELREVGRFTGKKITPEIVEEYKALRTRYGFDLVLLAAKYCNASGARPDSLGRMLMKWEELGLDSVEKVRAFLAEAKKHYDLMLELYEKWGITRKPTARDCRLARQWVETGFSNEMISTAADYAYEADDPPLYTTKVLSGFREKGITTPEQAEADRRRHRREAEEKRIQEKRQKEVEALKALGALGPYAGQREPDEQEEYNDDYFMNLMLERLNQPEQ